MPPTATLTPTPFRPHDVPTCRLDLAALMRQHKVTIRQLAGRMGVTQARVRAVRAARRVSYFAWCEWTGAVTGRVVFCRARYEAMNRQIERGNDRT